MYDAKYALDVDEELFVKLSELKKLIKNESIDVEFKSTTGEIKPACKTLCAFLNCNGGMVFIGVKDDGRIVGQMVTDNTRLEIANELGKFEPPANIKVDFRSYAIRSSVMFYF